MMDSFGVSPGPEKTSGSLFRSAFLPGFLPGFIAFALACGASQRAYASVPSSLREEWQPIVQRVLNHNPEVCLASLDAKIARAEVAAGNIDFETQLMFKPEYKHDRLLSNSTLESASYLETTGALSFGLKRKFNWGTLGEVVLQEMWLGSDSMQATFRDRDQMALQIKINQPLLKGFGLAANEATLSKARAKASRYSAELEVTANDSTLKALMIALEVARAKFEEQMKAEDEAFFQERKHEAEQRHKLGSLSRADMLAIAARMHVARAERLLASEKVLEQEEKFERETSPAMRSGNTPPKLLRFPGFSQLLASTADIPLTLPEPELATHPALVSLQLKEAETDADLGKASNALLPQLDLALQLSTVGAGQDHGTAEEGMLSRRTPSWQVIMTFSVPLENFSARGEHERLNAEKQSHGATIAKKRLALELDHRENQESLRAEHLKFRLTKERLQAAQEILRAKEAQFSSGKLNSADLIQARLDFSEAHSLALFASLNLRKTYLKALALSRTLLPQLTSTLPQSQRQICTSHSTL